MNIFFVTLLRCIATYNRKREFLTIERIKQHFDAWLENERR
jgi:hypothetical protein